MMQKEKTNNKQQWLAITLIIVIAFTAYFPAIDNFFCWDDFVWLYRAKSLGNNPLQIFNIDAVYFDPLVYFWFWIDYQIFQLNHFGYHLGDLIMHAVNGLLVYLLLFEISRERFAAFAGGILFVSSFATVDAVAWSSSRVDLLAVFFTLMSLFAFCRYLAASKRAFLFISLVFFIFALGAKGTPLLLPVLFAVILLQRKALATHYRLLFPFLAVILLYLLLIFWRLAATATPMIAGGGGQLSFYNLFLSFSELFVPEIYLTRFHPGPIAAVLAALIAAGCYPRLPGQLGQARLSSLTLMAIGLLPVLILKDVKLPTSMENAMYLLSSPSHRIYLASVGSAFLGGTLLAALTKGNVARKCLAYGLLSLIVVCGVTHIWQREKLWDGSSSFIRGAVKDLAAERHKLLDDSVIGLVNFPMSLGFMRPAIALYTGVERVLLLPMTVIPEDILDSPEIIRYKNRTFLLVYDGRRVHDLSEAFSLLVNVAFSHTLSSRENERSQLLGEYQSLAKGINAAIEESTSLQSPNL